MADRWKILYRYWLAKHVAGQPPSRADLDPLPDLRGLAANLMLLAVEGDSYRYRVAGTEIEAQAKMFLTGQLIGLPGTLPEMVADWRRALDHARDSQQARLYSSRLPNTIDAKYATLVLPLVDRQGRTEMILAGTFHDHYVEPGTHVLGMDPADMAP